MLTRLPHDITVSAEDDRTPQRHWIDITFKEAPVNLHSISFSNYYTHSLSIMQ